MSLREAAEEALEALENVRHYDKENLYGLDDDITALRTALAEDRSDDTGKTSDHFADADKMVVTINEMETVEPVAYSYTDARGRTVLVGTNTAPYEDAKPLYAAPPKREQLTDEEMWEVIGSLADTRLAGPLEKLIRATERAHGIGGEK